MDYRITTAANHEPVSLEQAKRHLRVDGSDEDASIRHCLRAARIWCEGFAGRAFLWQTVTVKLDDFPAMMDAPLPPLIAVSSITYVDSAGATKTVATSIYDVDTTSEPGKILLGYNQTWPTARGHHHDVTITLTAGHAAAFTRSGSTLIVPGHEYQVNDFVRVYNVGGALPGGLAAGTDYYVTAVAGTAISLATTEGGVGVTLSTDGTGTHYIDALPGHYVSAILLRLTDLWTHRGDDDGPAGRGIRELLWMGRMVHP